MFHVDADALLIFSIWASSKEVMPAQTLGVPGATPGPLLFQDPVPGQQPTQIAISLTLYLLLRCY